MFNSEKRILIGNRMKQRRKELKLSLQYVADRLEVSASTIQRYEAGTIDNTKKLIVESMAEVLHVTPEWLRGEIDVIESDYNDPALARIEDAFHELLVSYPLPIDPDASEFSRNLLLLLLMEVRKFNHQFIGANLNYTSGNEEFAKIFEMDSPEEFNRAMFHREIMSSINDLNDIVQMLHEYAKSPSSCQRQIKGMLKDFNIRFDDNDQ